MRAGCLRRCKVHFLLLQTLRRSLKLHARAWHLCQSASNTAATQPLTPWAHLMSQAMLQQQRERFAEKFTFQVKGVSFANDNSGESRQELLRSAATGDPVLCVKEPDNPVDTTAVRVMSIRGQIGYVPADVTAYFEHSCTPGYIEWVAPNNTVKDSLIGVRVMVLPSMRAVHMQALPPELVPWTDLSAHLPADRWAEIEQLHLDRTFHRCQLTGLHGVPMKPGDDDAVHVPPAVHPVWSVRELEKQVCLEGFVTICMPALLASNYLDLDVLPAGGVCGKMLKELKVAAGDEHGSKVAQAAAIDAIRFGNAFYDVHSQQPSTQQIWTRQHVHEYHASCRRTQRRIGDTGFQLDVGLLFALDLPSDKLASHELSRNLMDRCISH